MKTPTTRFVSLTAAMTLAVLHAAGATAAPKPGVPLMNDRAAARLADLPATAKHHSAVVGTLNAAALAAPAIELTLADGEMVTARLQRVARDEKKGTHSWIGTFDGSPGSLLVLSRARGVISGFASVNGETIEIQPTKSGKHAMFAVDTARIPLRDGVDKSVSGADVLAVATDYGTSVSSLDASSAVVQDILVLYTSAAAAARGQATLESNIQSAVQASNQAYQSSYANITLNIVGLQQSPVSESGSGMVATLNNFKSNATVRSLRDKLAADMVVLVSEDADYCGYATLFMSSGNTDAYAVVYSACMSNYSFTHEVGHLQWLDHDRANATGTHAYDYSYGYRQCVTGGFIDIMSYGCSSISVPRIPQFSNPSIYYNGYATGIAYESDPARAAEAARSLNGTATQVAGYRVSSSGSTVTPTVPAAPSGLSTRSLAYNAVALGWSDNSTNESGFKVERSGDGVNFTEIATLGADSTSFTDATVSLRTTYYYRVRAYNSTGGSGYSNTLAVTTPDAPPSPPASPTAVAAQNRADGSALVSWGDASTNETGFEVRRETWNSRRSVWTNLTTVGTVPANVASMIDVSGNGTYRYSVRAVNSGGGSGYAGPAQVTVSGGKGRKNF